MGMALPCSIFVQWRCYQELGRGRETRNDQVILLTTNSSAAILLTLMVFVKVIACRKMSVLHGDVFDESIFKASKHGNICKRLASHVCLLKSILN